MATREEKQTDKPIPVFWVHNPKGGVGKTLCTMAVIDWFLANSKVPLTVVETDASNPDVFKTYSKTVEFQTVRLNEHDGWVELGNLSEKLKDRILILNGAANNNEQVTEYGPLLSAALEFTGRPLVVLWVLDDTRD